MPPSGARSQPAADSTRQPKSRLASGSCVTIHVTIRFVTPISRQDDCLSPREKRAGGLLCAMAGHSTYVSDQRISCQRAIPRLARYGTVPLAAACASQMPADEGKSGPENARLPHDVTERLSRCNFNAVHDVNRLQAETSRLRDSIGAFVELAKATPIRLQEKTGGLQRCGKPSQPSVASSWTWSLG